VFQLLPHMSALRPAPSLICLWVFQDHLGWLVCTMNSPFPQTSVHPIIRTCTCRSYILRSSSITLLHVSLVYLLIFHSLPSMGSLPPQSPNHHPPFSLHVQTTSVYFSCIPLQVQKKELIVYVYMPLSFLVLFIPEKETKCHIVLKISRIIAKISC
jgi:hypothetical protein